MSDRADDVLMGFFKKPISYFGLTGGLGANRFLRKKMRLHHFESQVGAEKTSLKILSPEDVIGYGKVGNIRHGAKIVLRYVAGPDTG